MPTHGGEYSSEITRALLFSFLIIVYVFNNDLKMCNCESDVYVISRLWRGALVANLVSCY